MIQPAFQNMILVYKSKPAIKPNCLLVTQSSISFALLDRQTSIADFFQCLSLAPSSKFFIKLFEFELPTLVKWQLTPITFTICPNPHQMCCYLLQTKRTNSQRIFLCYPSQFLKISSQTVPKITVPDALLLWLHKLDPNFQLFL